MELGRNAKVDIYTKGIVCKMVVRIKAYFDFVALWVVSAGVWLFICLYGRTRVLGELDRKGKLNFPAAAAAKLLQSCPTLCDPIDGSPPGSPVPGILQARTLEWVAISFSNAWKWKVKVKSLSCVLLLATPWTTAYQAPPSVGFSRQEYWSGVPLPSPWTSLVVHLLRLHTSIAGGTGLIPSLGTKILLCHSQKNKGRLRNHILEWQVEGLNSDLLPVGSHRRVWGHNRKMSTCLK